MHLSDIRHYERCARLLWLCVNEPLPFEPFVCFNESISELAKQFYGLTTYYEGAVGDDPQSAVKALTQYDVLLNARFAYDDIRVKIPLMRRSKADWTITFFYTCCYPKESEAQKLADTLSVLKALQIQVEDVRILHLNQDYIRAKTLQVHELLIDTPYLYNRRNKAHHTALALIRECQRDVFALGEAAKRILAEACPQAKAGPACMRGGKCRYYAHCFPDKDEDTSILHLMQTAHKFDLIEQGYHDMGDIDASLLEGTRQQYAQIMAARNGGFYMDAFALNSWIKQNIRYPISYLDFEWETFAYPPYEGMCPFDVLVFQYSLHVEEQGKALTHDEYIGQGDCRIAFVEHLLANIPKEGTILVYNMEGAEKLRLQQLGRQFPQYEARLNALCERMVDLSLPFETGCLYDVRMRGYYSLKVLSEVFAHFDYHTLDISQGLQAARSWRMLECDGTQDDSLRQALLQYCAMDTYAEYLLLHQLMEMLKEHEHKHFPHGERQIAV